MKSKFSPKRSLFILGFTVVLFSLVFGLSTDAFSAKIIYIAKQENSGLTIRLKIPKINVDAAIEQVGITSAGAMDVPKGPDTVAWFNLGPRPGEIGSSVIDGHSGYKNNRPAVFDNLYKLKKGDKVYVEDSNGNKITFVINKISNYKENQNATDVFSSNDAQSHLNLITCSGIWNKIDKTHSDRLVVFADREI